MKILLTGAGGQLGQELQVTKPAGMELFALNHQNLDITQADKVHAAIATLKPDIIINASAYTAVDDAEKNKDLAYAVNVMGPMHLAQAAYIHEARLIHISTDYVFDGTKKSAYLPTDLPSPVNYYGITKWEGERKVLEILENKALIIRTSWVYSQYGKNFVKGMLQYLAQREQMSMVTDQIGTPTWAKKFAQVIWQAIQKENLFGIYHWSDDGVVSKFEFLVAIQEEGLKLKLLKKAIPILPIHSIDFPTPAKRPMYAVLDKTSSIQDFQVQPLHWRDALKEMLMDLCIEVCEKTL